MTVPTENITIEGLRSVANTCLPDGAQVWLYGSRARGDAHSDSDWDILIVVDKSEREASDFESYSTPFIDYGFDHGQIVMPHVYTQNEWQKYAFTPFVMNVERDKIVLK